MDVSSTVAAGVNLGYSLTWIVGYLANRPDLQQNGYEAIREVYNGEAPKPHEFDRVEYVKALHTVSIPIWYMLSYSSSPDVNIGRFPYLHARPSWFPASDP